MKEILELLSKNADLTVQQLAVMLDMTEDEVNACIEKMKKDKVLLGYKPLINWDKTDREFVTAMIELRITPQRGEGFDKVAERIYKYPQVKALYLMSGSYDLSVTIEGHTMKEVALFVAEKLAPMESVISTATHFVLKKYKQEGVVFEEDEVDTRQVITL